MNNTVFYLEFSVIFLSHSQQKIQKYSSNIFINISKRYKNMIRKYSKMFYQKLRKILSQQINIRNILTISLKYFVLCRQRRRE